MSDLGNHVLLDLAGCPAECLTDRERLVRLLREAAELAGATIIGEQFHSFAGDGVSGVLLIAESHLSIHTWPELGEVAIDVYTCSAAFQAELAADHLEHALGARRSRRTVVRRGIEAASLNRRLA